MRNHAIPSQTHPMRGVVRTVEVLRALNGRNGARVSDLARHTGIPRPSLYRILETLKSLGYVRRRDDGERYDLTLQVRALSDGFKDEDWIQGVALPELEALQREIVWPTDIATFFDDAMYLRETTRRNSPLTIDTATVGLRLPLLQSATGRAYLAFCPEGERSTIIDNLKASRDANDKAARDARFVTNLLAMTRRKGYGERQREIFPKTGAIAIPLMHGRRVACCLNISYIASALTPREAAARYLESLRKTARTIEARLAKQS
jgi:IclR family transcriptional regulator, mhp operon transcriptional activator